MTVKVQVGPPQIAIHQGQTVLISEEDGQINWPSDNGLYFLDTRIISSWRIYTNGEPWELLNGGATSYYAPRIYLTNRSFLTKTAPFRRAPWASPSDGRSVAACMKISTSSTTA
jgi:hypothetical protein